MGFGEVTAREKMCSRSSAGRARRGDLGDFEEKRSMVLWPSIISMRTKRPTRGALELIWF